MSPRRNAHEGPFPEYYDDPGGDGEARAGRPGWGGRIIAVGTTVVRALETMTERGRVAGSQAPAAGPIVRITPERGVWLVDGLITGWHEPEASHLEMLEALAGRELLERCYDAALGHGYLWHEFGDSHLILP